MNEPLINEGVATEPRRRPYRGEGTLWLLWHRIRGHDAESWGWIIGRSGPYRNWFCINCCRTWR